MTPLLLSCGDPAGVGPAVAVRAAVDRSERQRIVLFGDERRLAALVAQAAPGLALLPAADVAPAGLSIVDCGAVRDEVLAARGPTPEGGRAQLAALDAAIDRALAGRGAVVTAPTSKTAVERSGVPFVGQTEHLARRSGLPDDAVTMMFLGPRLSVALATTHLALRGVPDALTVERVERAIAHLASALALTATRRPLCGGGHGPPGSRSALAHPPVLGALARAPIRIAVAGLNPHAGESGLFGSEERERIEPAVERARVRLPGVDLEGPLGAETALRRAASGEVDGVVAMFHDQATIASKLLDWGAAVNVTWGLPFVRTSVDHGVAYDAAASGTADASGMGAALDLAARLTGAGP